MRRTEAPTSNPDPTGSTDRTSNPDPTGGTDPLGDPQGPAERAAARRAAVARAATGSTGAAVTTDSRRSSATAPEPTLERTIDLDRDGRPDTMPGRDARTGASTDRNGRADTATERDARTGTLTDRDTRVGTLPDRDGRPDRDVRADGGVGPAPVVPAGPKPRASLLATLGLIVGVASALFVLTGTLAGYGIALGAVAAVLSVFGLMATRRRHVAGTTDALIGMLLGLGAVVLGVLAMTGQFVWPTTDGDWVLRFREWLDAQFVNRF
ncbi:DUF308 domain-containing protein [Micromonospora echinofusca]|uniref:Thrombospondin n=1 Tax=Micromonospora echinofusca TaxID=47858 RepID=A0ABS3VZ55_MICEH|nr:DUF308 domain-containing protein [Micromonospora echinofusca]MBO4209807.1 hypothetical protein [Micromonospora echinofusca]